MAMTERLSLTVRPTTIHSEGCKRDLPGGVEVQIVLGDTGRETVRVLLGRKEQRRLTRLLMEHDSGDTPAFRAFIDKHLHYWRQRWDALSEER